MSEVSRIRLRSVVVWAGRLLVLAAIAWLGWRLWNQRQELAVLGLGGAEWLALYGVTVLYTLVSLLLALAWALAVRAMSDTRVTLRPLVAVHLKTQIAKYLPGNVFHYAGRQLAARELGLGQIPVAAASGLEIAGQAGTAALLALTAVLSLGFAGEVRGTVLLVVVFLLALASPWLLRFLLRKLWRKQWSLPSTNLLVGMACLYLVYLLCIAVLFWQVGRLCGMADVAVILVAGAFVVAWTAGFLLPGAPGGLGVREAILVVLLSPITGEPAALAAALVFRLVSVAGDVHLLGIGLLTPLRRD